MRPNENGTRMPKQMQIWVKLPAGPLTSTGEISLMNFGQKTENPPLATPYRNLPISRRVKLLMRVNPAPTSTTTFVMIKHFHLPNPRSGPENKAPTADPAVVRDWVRA